MCYLKKVKVNISFTLGTGVLVPTLTQAFNYRVRPRMPLILNNLNDTKNVHRKLTYTYYFGYTLLSLAWRADRSVFCCFSRCVTVVGNRHIRHCWKLKTIWMGQIFKKYLFLSYSLFSLNSILHYIYI